MSVLEFIFSTRFSWTKLNIVEHSVLTNHDTTEVGSSQQEDVTRDLDMDTDVFSSGHVYETTTCAGLNHPLASEQCDGADCVLTGLDLLEIVQCLNWSNFAGK